MASSPSLGKQQNLAKNQSVRKEEGQLSNSQFANIRLKIENTSGVKLASSWHHILCENCQWAGPKGDPEAPSSGPKEPQ